MLESSFRFAAPIGRLLIGVLFLMSVAKKIAAPDATIAALANLGLPAAGLFYGLAVAAELGGTLMVVLGWRARAGAALLIAFTVAATILVHFHPSDPAQMTHVFKNLAIIGGLLQLFTFGSGTWSIDGGAQNRQPME